MTNPNGHQNALFPWITFFESFADSLKKFHKDRASLISLIYQASEQSGVHLARLDSTLPPQDIDPFTVFGLFNKGMTTANRKALAQGLATLLGTDAAAPQNFEGVPVLNNLNATFYRFTGDPLRKDHDIDQLWELFEAALFLSAEESDAARERFCSAYDAARELPGTQRKLSMGLSMVRPTRFISLDSRNTWYIASDHGQRSCLPESVIDLIPDLEHLSTVPTGMEYLTFCDAIASSCATGTCAFSSFPDLSRKAWIESERVNKEKKQKKMTSAGMDPVLGGERGTHYWLYSPGRQAMLWDQQRDAGIMEIGWGKLGDLTSYVTREMLRRTMTESYGPGKHVNSTLCIWQFVHELQPGDIVFAKRGNSEIIGRGVVTGEYTFDPEPSGSFPNSRSVDWTHSGTWTYPGKAPVKTLTDITDYVDTVQQLNALFDTEDEDAGGVAPESPLDPYAREDFLRDVFMDAESFDTLSRLLDRKKNIILEGAPGTGKTFAAKRLAYARMGVQDPERVHMVQFHQSYSYEDFIEGYRPTVSGGFELKHGIFYDFCRRAQEDRENDYYFIIDEINRGNLSKILGELFMLLEADKRDVKVNLLYSNERFAIPGNVYLIGTMNTADRGIAMIDYALRRRFGFFTLEPGFKTEAFSSYRERVGSAAFTKLVSRIDELNRDIAKDESLGDGYVIGHSFLCLSQQDAGDIACLRQVIDFEIAPLLQEYWFDEPSLVRDWIQRLRDAVA